MQNFILIKNSHLCGPIFSTEMEQLPIESSCIANPFLRQNSKVSLKHSAAWLV